MNELPVRWTQVEWVDGPMLRITRGAPVVPGDVLKNVRTGENVLVTTASGPRLTVDRGIGSVDQQPMELGDDLLVLGNARAPAEAVDTESDLDE